MDNKEFVWTNELVYEFINFHDNNCKIKPTWTSESAAEFKKSKQVEKNKDWTILETEKAKIISVKRLSDNEVFTVGDKMKMINYVTIDHFAIVGDEMIAFHKSGARLPLGCLQKPIIEQPLFTTEDGKSIYEGDKFWVYSHYNESVSEQIAEKYHTIPHDKLVCCSTKERAQLYKPILSYTDIAEIVDYCSDSQQTLLIRIQELVKQKINQK